MFESSGLLVRNLDKRWLYWKSYVIPKSDRSSWYNDQVTIVYFGGSKEGKNVGDELLNETLVLKQTVYR